MDYLDLTGPDGQTPNMGGLQQKFYFARVDDFATIGSPSASPTTPGDTVEISTAHTFKTGKCFRVGYCTLDKGGFKADAQGDRDGESFKQEGTVFVPGSDVELHGFASLSKSDRFIALMPMPDGKVMQIGNAMFYANVKSAFDTASNSSGVRGYTFTWESMGPRNLVYSAAISLTPAP